MDFYGFQKEDILSWLAIMDRVNTKVRLVQNNIPLPDLCLDAAQDIPRFKILSNVKVLVFDCNDSVDVPMHDASEKLEIKRGSQQQIGG